MIKPPFRRGHITKQNKFYRRENSKDMAKRFTDTDKYKKPFLRGLQGAYKLLWDYICNDCNHAGIWIVDFEVARIYLGKDMEVNQEEALRVFNADKKRVVEIEGGSRWFILSFIEFQYGALNPQNRAHSSVISYLKSYHLWDDKKNIIKPLTSPLQGAMDKDKDKDKDMDKEKGENFTFEEVWNLYQKKVGDKSKLQKKWDSISGEDKAKIFEHIPLYKTATPDRKFRKNFETYLNNKSWNDEIITDESPKSTSSNAKPQSKPTEPRNYDDQF